MASKKTPELPHSTLVSQCYKDLGYVIVYRIRPGILHYCPFCKDVFTERANCVRHLCRHHRLCPGDVQRLEIEGIGVGTVVVPDVQAAPEGGHVPEDGIAGSSKNTSA